MPRALADVSHALPDGYVQRVSVTQVGAREVALVQVRLPPRPPALAQTVYVVLAAGIGVGVVDTHVGRRLREAMANEAVDAVTASTQPLWRARLAGARLVAWAERDLDAVAGGMRWRAGTGRPDALTWTELSHPSAAHADASPGDDVGAPALNEARAGLPMGALEAGARLVERIVEDRFCRRRQTIARALAKAIARLDRRIEAMLGDLRRIEEALGAGQRARLFVSQAAMAPRGATTLEAVDWSTGEPTSIVLEIDPARGAREQIDALFKRARRLKEGATITHGRLADARAARDALAAVASALPSALPDDLDLLESRARGEAPRDFRLGGRLPPPGESPRAARRTTRGPLARLPYRCFVGSAGKRIFVGRSATHNDTLTFRVARPHDLWLHAKNRAGAHVVVPLEKGGSCPAELLVEAAHLAAHFSDGRDERVIEVQYAARRHLRKPRGSAPGLVVVDREKVIVLRREDDVMRRLLETELEA